MYMFWWVLGTHQPEGVINRCTLPAESVAAFLIRGSVVSAFWFSLWFDSAYLWLLATRRCVICGLAYLSRKQLHCLWPSILKDYALVNQMHCPILTPCVFKNWGITRPFKVRHLLICSIFTKLCSRYHYIIPECFHHLKKRLCTH